MGLSSLSLSPWHSASPESATETAYALPPLVADCATELIPGAVARVLEDGHRVDAERPFREVLNQTLGQRDPRRRILLLSRSSFNPAVAVARFIWHLSARSDLSSIEFYEPRARLFSDDGKVLPGSNTGARLFGQEEAGDQISGLISRLREDNASRRGMAVIWRPEDSTRASKDIPCTVALACHIREGRLFTTVSMRSNNALRLLPYNLFEFTMLAEMIATELGIEPGPYCHIVNSLHVFEDDLEAAGLVVRGAAEGASLGMTPMPGQPFLEAGSLTRHEVALREAFLKRDWEQLGCSVAQAKADLHPYWFGLYATLALFCARRLNEPDAVNLTELASAVPPALRRKPANAD